MGGPGVTRPRSATASSEPITRTGAIWPSCARSGSSGCRRLLRASDLDCLLVWKDENVRYLTGMRAQIISGKSAVLNGVPPARRRAADPAGLGRRLPARPGDDDLDRRVPPDPDPRGQGPDPRVRRGDPRARCSREHGLESARIGIDECSFIQVEELGRALPEVELADGDTLMQECRRVKMADELALMEEAAAIAEAVHSAAIAAVAPGVRETDVAAVAMHTLYRLGGEMAHVATPFVASGEHMGAAEPAGDGQDHPRGRPRLHRHRGDVERLLRATWRGP